MSLALAAPFRDNREKTKRELSPPPNPTVRLSPHGSVYISFAVTRHLPDPLAPEETNDTFCDKGLDAPGNITIHVFFRNRIARGVIGDWNFVQRNSARILGANETVGFCRSRHYNTCHYSP